MNCFRVIERTCYNLELSRRKFSFRILIRIMVNRRDNSLFVYEKKFSNKKYTMDTNMSGFHGNDGNSSNIRQRKMEITLGIDHLNLTLLCHSSLTRHTFSWYVVAPFAATILYLLNSSIHIVNCLFLHLPALSHTCWFLPLCSPAYMSCCN